MNYSKIKPQFSDYIPRSTLSRFRLKNPQVISVNKEYFIGRKGKHLLVLFILKKKKFKCYKKKYLVFFTLKFLLLDKYESLHLKLPCHDEDYVEDFIHNLQKYPIITQLKSLNLSNCNITKFALKQMSHCYLPNLIHFDLSNNNLQNGGMIHLVRIYMPSLENLSIEGNSIYSAGVRCLTAGNWINLKKLNIGNNEIDEEGLMYIKFLKSENFAKLNISRNYLKHGMQTLEAIKLTKLKSLNISKNYLNFENLDIKNLNLENLRKLNLSECGCLTYTTELNFLDKMRNLEKLNLGRNYFNEGSLNNLFQMSLPIKHLNLERCFHSGIAKILAYGNWTQLEVLILFKTRTDNEGLFHISRGNFTKLTKLDVRGCLINERGLNHLKTGNLINLTKILY